MLDSFNKSFNIEKGTPLKRAELEDALIEMFSNIQFSVFKWEQEEVLRYTLGANFEWETNNIETQSDYTSPENALMGLFLENRKKSWSKKIVQQVYGGNDERGN